MIYKISPDPSLPKRGEKCVFAKEGEKRGHFPKEGR